MSSVPLLAVQLGLQRLCTLMMGQRSAARRRPWTWESLKKLPLGCSRMRIAARHKTGSVGAILDHASPKPLRDHARDNVRLLRDQARQRRLQRAAEVEEAGKPTFKLRQFENVPSRFHQTPPRTPEKRSQSVPSSPGGFGSCVSRGLTPSPPTHTAAPGQRSPGSPPAERLKRGNSTPSCMRDRSTPPPSRGAGVAQRSPGRASPPDRCSSSPSGRRTRGASNGLTVKSPLRRRSLQGPFHQVTVSCPRKSA